MPTEGAEKPLRGLRRQESPSTQSHGEESESGLEKVLVILADSVHLGCENQPIQDCSMDFKNNDFSLTKKSSNLSTFYRNA